MSKTGCYILFSDTLGKFYIGMTQEGIEERLIKHNHAHYGKHFTSGTADWRLFLFIPCDSVAQAVNIERHIKKMKSKTYIQNLLRYPEIIDKLKLKYPGSLT